MKIQLAILTIVFFFPLLVFQSNALECGNRKLTPRGALEDLK